MKKNTFFKDFLCTMALFFTTTISDQAVPEVLKDWRTLEGVKFLF